MLRHLALALLIVGAAASGGHMTASAASAAPLATGTPYPAYVSCDQQRHLILVSPRAAAAPQFTRQSVVYSYLLWDATSNTSVVGWWPTPLGSFVATSAPGGTEGGTSNVYVTAGHTYQVWTAYSWWSGSSWSSFSGWQRTISFFQFTSLSYQSTCVA
jgi:hypothetical protein